MKNNKIVIIASVIIVIALVILTVAGSYAFYTATLAPTGKNTMGATAAGLELTFTDKSATINVDNLIPGETVTKTFSVQNTGTVAVKFKVVINNVSNTFTHKSDVTIALKEGTQTLKTITFPDKTAPLSDAISIEPKTTKNYTVTITYTNTNNSNQIDDMGKKVSGKIFIEGVA